MEEKIIVYGKFWPRFWAHLLDSLVLSAIVGVVGYYNITQFKSFSLYFVFMLIGVFYKPVLEYYFGATLGKMVLKLKVISVNYGKITFEQAFLRNLLQILPMIFYVPIQYLAFNNPEFLEINSYLEFAKQTALAYPTQEYISNVSMALLMAEIIFLLTDENKRYRALHDRLAKTYVIKA